MLTVVLVREFGVDSMVLQRTKQWFDRFDGPIRVQLADHSAVRLKKRRGVLKWSDLFQTLGGVRAELRLPGDQWLYLLTCTPNENNWFAAEDPSSPRNAFGHIDDFSWITQATADVVVAHYVLKTVLNGLVSEAGFDWRKLWHHEPRGCFFDFCADKKQLDLKLKTADICGDCTAVLRELAIPERILAQTVAIMEGQRRSALNTGQYLAAEERLAQWPFPVAVTRHRVAQARNPVLRFLMLFDHFDALVRYFFLANEVSQGRRPVLVERPTMGWWVEQLARVLPHGDPFREVVRIEAREHVVQLRNNTRGHAWMTEESALYAEDAQRLERALGQIESELAEFFSSTTLLRFRGVRLRAGNYLVEGDALKGSNLLHPPFSEAIEREPRAVGLADEGLVYLKDSKGMYHRMSPYVVVNECPECRHERVLMSAGTADYTDTFIGHRVVLPSAP